MCPLGLGMVDPNGKDSSKWSELFLGEFWAEFSQTWYTSYNSSVLSTVLIVWRGDGQKLIFGVPISLYRDCWILANRVIRQLIRLNIPQSLMVLWTWNFACCLRSIFSTCLHRKSWLPMVRASSRGAQFWQNCRKWAKMLKNGQFWAK